jgi:hypothetical protein
MLLRWNHSLAAGARVGGNPGVFEPGPSAWKSSTLTASVLRPSSRYIASALHPPCCIAWVFHLPTHYIASVFHISSHCIKSTLDNSSLSVSSVFLIHVPINTCHIIKSFFRSIRSAFRPSTHCTSSVFRHYSRCIASGCATFLNYNFSCSRLLSRCITLFDLSVLAAYV